MWRYIKEFRWVIFNLGSKDNNLLENLSCNAVTCFTKKRDVYNLSVSLG
jgi:hypothetical protein